MTTRAVVYARFSSDRQRDRSINDQVALCREFAARAGFVIGAVYADHAVSGSTVHRREFARLLADAKAKVFDIISWPRTSTDLPEANVTPRSCASRWNSSVL